RGGRRQARAGRRPPAPAGPSCCGARGGSRGSPPGSVPGCPSCGSVSLRVCCSSGSLRHLEAVVPLTRRQREILDFLTSSIEGQGYAPSLEEIAEQFGYQSLATVHEHLTNLEAKGCIRRSYNESRSIEVLPPR